MGVGNPEGWFDPGCLLIRDAMQLFALLEGHR